MIKIIKEGRPNKTATCTECGCVFLYEPEDVIMTPSMFDGKIDESITCPCCGNEMPLKKYR